MSLEKDQAFFKNFSIVVVILAMLMIVFVVTANVVGNTVPHGNPDAKAAQVSERTAPVGDVRLEGESIADESDTGNDTGKQEVAAAADEPKSGQAVYDSVCMSCHSGAIAAAPTTGDKAAWAPRIEKGIETLYKHAINGFQGEGSAMAMPARGGVSSLSDKEVKVAVDYMVEQSQ